MPRKANGSDRKDQSNRPPSDPGMPPASPPGWAERSLALAADVTLTDPAVRVAMALLLVTRGGVVNYATDRQIATLACMTIQKARRGLKVLEQRGYLKSASFVATAQLPSGRELTLAWLVDPSVVPEPVDVAAVGQLRFKDDRTGAGTMTGTSSEHESPDTPFGPLFVIHYKDLACSLENLAKPRYLRAPFPHAVVKAPDAGIWWERELEDDRLTDETCDLLAGFLRHPPNEVRPIVAGVRDGSIPVASVFEVLVGAMRRAQSRSSDPGWKPGDWAVSRLTIPRLPRGRAAAPDAIRPRREFDTLAAEYDRWIARSRDPASLPAARPGPATPPTLGTARTHHTDPTGPPPP